MTDETLNQESTARSPMERKLKQGLKILSVLLLLYFFLVSIKLMGASFHLFGKGFAEQLINSYPNPFLGLFTGILATSLVQSSPIITSLIVGLAGSGVLPFPTVETGFSRLRREYG